MPRNIARSECDWEGTITVPTTARGRSPRVSILTRGWALGLLAMTAAVVTMSGPLERDAGKSRTRPVQLHQAGRECLMVALAFTPDGRTLAASDSGEQLTIWNVENQTIRSTRTTRSVVRSLVVSPDGRVAVGADQGEHVWAWDLDSGEERVLLHAHGRRIASVTLAPGARTLAASTTNGELTLWDLPEGRLHAVLAEAGEGLNTVNAIAFSPDGFRLAAGGLDGTTRIWDVASGGLLRVLRHDRTRLEYGRGTIVSVAFAPDGKTLATAGGFDPVVCLWDIEGGRQIEKLEELACQPVFVAYTETGQRLFSVGHSGTVFHWGRSARAWRSCFTASGARFPPVVLNADGTTMAIGEGEKVSLWRVASPPPAAGMPPRD